MTNSEVTVDAWTGWRCVSCGCTTLFEPAACPRCNGTNGKECALSTSGVVWTRTVQRFAPKSPPYVPPAEGFSPFVVAYVELPEGLRVEAIVRADDVDDVQIGDVVELIETVPVPVFAPKSNRGEQHG